MKLMKNVLVAVMLALLVAGTAYAGSDKEDWHASGDDDKWAGMRAMMHERQKMNEETMVMVRDMMVILNSLNHKPSGIQKEQLSGMIAKFDAMIKRNGEMSVEWKVMQEKMNKMKMDGDSHHGH